MTYDNAGNLNNDTYTGAGSRTYDAENRMTTAWGGNNQSQIYTYNADGQRTRRKVDGVETWQIYGFGGELLAEYAANAAVTTPQKEYGYRNGQLLITATVTTGWGSPPVLNDNPLLVGQTTVQSRHITELRDAINALRSHLNLSAYSWQTSAAPGDLIKADPILEMRTALDQALGAPSPAYNAGLAQGQQILAIHIQELRNRVLAAWISGGGVDIRWLVLDQLGTPRMVFDQSGSLATVSRHDYLPFGEELFAGTGGRTTAQGYPAPGANPGDGARQKFTGYEADAETGLNFAQARYQSSVQGRFTSVDPLLASASVGNPQSFNRYTYVVNNPVNLTDPSGMVNNHGDSLYPWEEDHWGDIPWTVAGQRQQQTAAAELAGAGIAGAAAGLVSQEPQGPTEVLTINTNEANILDFDLNLIHIFKDRYGKEGVPIGGEFEIYYKYYIPQPIDGGKPEDYGKITGVILNVRPPSGTFSDSSFVQLTNTHVKVNPVQEGVTVEKTERYVVKKDPFVRWGGTYIINYRIAVTNPKSGKTVDISSVGERGLRGRKIPQPVPVLVVPKRK